MIQLQPWIPYMGNKAGILANIEGTIKSLNIPRPTCFVDLFCGGGSVGYYMATHGYSVIMNDIEPGLINLHKTLKIHPERLKLFSAIAPTKEEFKACVSGNSDYDAYIKILWSFGTKCDTYLTSVENEQNKIEEYMRGEAEPNSRLKHLEDIVLMYSHYNPDIELVNDSYENVAIPDGALVYCDIPYKNTQKYISGGFDYEKFYAWAMAQPNLVLISEYEMPECFHLVDAYTKQTVLGGADTRQMTTERLYSNKPVDILRLF